MANLRFLQIHTLTTYTAALLNRDDSGLAKRLPYGDHLRTRISSQCLKRHWRVTDDVHSLDRIDGTEASYRSRELVTKMVIEPLREDYSEEIVDAIEPEFQMAVYGDKGTTTSSRQTLLLGQPEIDWLANEAQKLAEVSSSNAEDAKKNAVEWRSVFRANIRAMREATSLPGGMAAALFGRMVTSDTAANIDAPVHVAHSFTVHAEEAEGDYFTAMDDLPGDDPGADTIQETELTSGLFYGYVVIDLQGLLENLGDDEQLAGEVLHNLIYLIAEVSPGAKRGSTAPYGRASFMLLEAGDRQPRSMAEAFRKPAQPKLENAVTRFSSHLSKLDDAYATGETRKVMCLAESDVPGATKASIPELAEWAREIGRSVDS